MNKKNIEHQNKPYYMNNCGEVKVTPIPVEKEVIKEVIKKFRLGIDKNGNAIITIDNTIHFMNFNQFHAFTLAVINISKKVNPEIDYVKIFLS